ncbi:hypothetical protein E1301_Tti005116 [Triplophysa tibetana]|uniref:Leucine-rich repeat-containing protein 19 n=1 Tax=Triplophysa tibetana TaxID=1572043 RepID=A0A5A9NVZ5_9TELE|nr:hypothetical protein E1301_Tti005116 [Triplophysa tibetana]
MGFAAHTLCVLLCFWVSGSCLRLQTEGMCTVDRETVAFDCSKKRLTSVPHEHIWRNVTKLDLSDNVLDLTHTDSFKQLNLFSQLTTLNLSGNYLPLLFKDHLFSLPSLKILDLSRCELKEVETRALIRLPSLQTLFLGNNHLQGPLLTAAQEMKKTEGMDHHDYINGYSKNDNREIFLRKLLEDNINTLPNPTVKDDKNGNRTDDGSKSSSYSWKILVAVLVSAISISVLIALTAKCKLVHKYLASYRHSRLSEADATSQCDPGNFEVGFSSHGGPGTRATVSTDDIEEDDDGFIEDNYIQASESQRAARAAELNEDDDDDEEEEDEIEFTIG